jgi:hypothetical protein
MNDLCHVVGTKEAVLHTLQALKGNSQIIYQATLEHEPFAGIADFLQRVDYPSNLGAYSFEVIDAKMGHPKASIHHLTVLVFGVAGPSAGDNSCAYAPPARRQNSRELPGR